MRFHMAMSSALTPCALAMRYSVSPLRTVTILPAFGAGRVAAVDAGVLDAEGLRTTVVFAQPASRSAQPSTVTETMRTRPMLRLTSRPSAAVHAPPGHRR